MSAHIEKAQLLIGQERFEPALRELQQALVGEPDQPHAHALLAICLRQLNRVKEALDSARRAVQAGPDYAFAHYVLSGVYDQMDQLDAAEKSIREAIRLDPQDADYLTRLAGIHLQRRRWEEALQVAESALELDSVNAQALNFRTMALDALDRVDDAGAASRGALAANPEDPSAHASAGWQALRGGDVPAALAHFKEALRLDSSHAWAREGLVEALKARNPIYRVVLSYFLWTARLQPKVLWGFIIGGYLLSRVLREFGKSHPQWAPYTWFVLGPYFGFCLLTWVAEPVFNLLLRLHPIGRVALSPRQTSAANWFGMSLALASLALLAWFVVRSDALVLLAVVAGLMAIPLSGALETAPGRARKLLLGYAAVLGACGTFAVLGSVGGISSLGGTAMAVFALGVVAYPWLANGIKIRS